MQELIKKTIAALASLFIFALCSGFFNTLISLAMHQKNATALSIGLMNCIFYVGLVCGAYRIEPFILRVGHIRAYCAFASSLAVMSMLHGLSYSIPIWFILRFLTGVGTAGIFVVIESWLLSCSQNANRGRILSIYMIVFYASEAFGQLLIGLETPDAILMYCIAAMLCSLSVIPLAITRFNVPKFKEPSMMSLSELCRKTTSAFLGCFFAGMVLSAAYGLFPLLCYEYYQDNHQVSVAMFCLIIGGMIVQYPIGKWSDSMDRRIVVMMICLMAWLSALLLSFSIQSYYTSLPLITFLGGLSTTIYPICISYACDKLQGKEMVAGIQGLLLSFSIGATIGPMMASLFMSGHHPIRLFYYFMVIFTITLFIFLTQTLRKKSPIQEVPFQMLKHTTPLANRYDPRV